PDMKQSARFYPMWHCVMQPVGKAVINHTRILEPREVERDLWARWHGAALAAKFKRNCAVGEEWPSSSESSTHLLFLASPAVEVYQGEHGAVDLIIGSAIGADAQRIHAASFIVHLKIAHAEGVDDFVDDSFQIWNVDVRLQFGDGPSDISISDVKGLAGHRRGSPNHQCIVHHHNRKMNAAEQIVQVAVDLHDLQVPVAELFIQSR